jgi:phenylacetate-CoA ligase
MQDTVRVPASDARSPSGAGTGAAGHSATLSRLERMTRAELEALQLRKIRRTVERAWHRNPFYRRKWEAAGVRPEQIRTLDDFRKRIPVCTKQDFLEDQQEHKPFGSRLGIPREDVVLINLTGGTSGQGQEIYGRSNHDVAMQGFLHYLPWFIAGLRPGDVALNCVPQGGMTTGGWGPGEGFRLAGATTFHGGGAMSTDAKVDLLQRFGELHFIYASTNYLHTLTEAFRRRGIRPGDLLPMMKTLFIAAEGYPMEWARATEAQWGCRLHEGYGSTQGAGFVCMTCERGVVRGDRERGLMHLLEWINHAEVIDPDTGSPVGEGEEGEIILTNLDIEGSPVIRFSTRDKARWFPASACGCGRPWHTLEAGSIGRYDDMMKIRGNNVWPLAVDTCVFAHPEIAEYVGRVFVDDAGRTEVELRIALKADAAALGEDGCARLLARLQGEIKTRTNVLMRLVAVPLDTLPVFTYKARRWTDERGAGYAARAGR